MSTKPAYKYHYFDGKGRGEVVRQLFKLADIDFVDNRIKLEDWPALKDSAPGKQVPYLELGNGVILTQTMSIARYVAREYGLCGSTNLNQAICDIIASTANELIDKAADIIFTAKTEEEKAEAKTKLDAALGIMEDTVVRLQKDKSKFVLGDRPSLADAALHATLEFVRVAVGESDLLDKYDNINRIEKNFAEVPRIAAWIKERPQTPMW